MLTIEGLIAVISLVLTAFGLRYAIGSKDNHKTQKQPPCLENCAAILAKHILGLPSIGSSCEAPVTSKRLFLPKE